MITTVGGGEVPRCRFAKGRAGTYCRCCQNDRASQPTAHAHLGPAHRARTPQRRPPEVIPGAGAEALCADGWAVNSPVAGYSVAEPGRDRGGAVVAGEAHASRAMPAQV